MKQQENNLTPVILLLLVVLAGVSTLALISISEEREEDAVVPLPPHMYSSSQYTIGTGNKLGTYFPTGKFLSGWLNEHLDSKGGSFNAFETNGSVDNIELLQSGRIDFGMAECRIVKETYVKNPNIRVVCPLWLDVVQVLKPPSYMIPNYVFPSKLKGFLGQKKSSTLRTSKEIFKALGITGRHGVDIPNSSVIETIADGRLGFATIQAGIPNPSVSEAIVFNNCGLVSFDKEQVELIKSEISTSVPFTISAGYYSEKQPEINTLALPNVLITTTEASPELVEFVAKMIMGSSHKLKERFKVFATVPATKEEIEKVLDDTGVPLHEGAKRWLRKHWESSKREGEKIEQNL